MKKSERLVSYYDLHIEASSRTFSAPKPIGVRRAFELMELVPKEARNKESSHGHDILYVADWERKGDILSILVSKSDKSIADPVFTVPKQKKRRTAAKEEQEGQDFSVHVVVRIPDNDLDPAIVVIEQCVGLSITFITRLFNHLLRDAKTHSPDDYEQTHPDGAVDEKGRPKKYNVVFKCCFEGHLSEELKDDLNQGKVQSIELITEKDRYTNFDETGYIKEKCKTVVLTLRDDNPVRDKYDRIMSMFKQKKDDYDQARIKFKTPEGIDRTVAMDTTHGIAQAYVKKAKLDGFNGDLKSSYEHFCPEILAKMKELV